MGKLEEKNPVVYDNGGRKFKLFQFLTDHVGMAAFRQHLWQVVGIGEASQDKVQFDRGFYQVFPEARPRKGDERQLVSSQNLTMMRDAKHIRPVWAV